MEGDFTVSAKIISITAIAWLLWDVYAYIKSKKTISHYMVKWSRYSPAIPFIVGFICGHWFWT